MLEMRRFLPRHKKAANTHGASACFRRQWRATGFRVIGSIRKGVDENQKAAKKTSKDSVESSM